MVDQTKIEWTDFTVNFWEGCQKVGPGCDHCYAETRNHRFSGGENWGPGAPRRKVKAGLPKLAKINRDAGKFEDEHGRPPRVFCSSLSDVFDNAVDPAWREEAFDAMACAPATRIQMLTKRIGNVERMVPEDWRRVWPSHVGLMITVVTQTEADRDISKLLDLKKRLGIPWVGLSMEPLIEAVDLTGHLWGRSEACEGCPGDAYCDCGFLPRHMLGGEGCIDWVIVGGEDGPGARPMHPDWPRLLRNQCQNADTPFLFKQWGAWGPDQFEIDDNTYQDAWLSPDGTVIDGAITDVQAVSCVKPVRLMVRYGKHRTGRHLDHVTHDQVPEKLK